MRFFFALFFAVSFSATAQPYSVPQVPHKMNFAGINLTIRDDARREIQKDVDALWQSPKHFNIKAERAKTYFPIIEKIFTEERVPDDFKYLVLQESALIADAVSVSNAVGFWQFKDFTAMEMGLRVDEVIDERMNIFSATRGAAKYIKRNNYQFNNWVYALQAYQMGAGGVARSVKDVESGARHMDITSNTYWYVKKFLAHKIAFENAVLGKPVQPISSYENSKQKSIAEVAADLSMNADELLAFNKWIRKGRIPDDRLYVVLVPLAENRIKQIPSEPITTIAAAPAKSTHPTFILINGVPAIQAKGGESLVALATRAN
jgi:membrane-bound lytic murein transglycosylase D